MNLYLDVFQQQVEEKRRKLVDEPINIDLIDKNKYANNSEFVPDHVYRRLLNKISNFQWSFLPYSITEHAEHTEYIGLLIVPGFGVHTGVGTAKKQKKDNSNTLASAKTYAFKNACKEMGLAPNVGNKTWEDDLFEFDEEAEEEIDMTEQTPPAKAKGKAKKKPAKKMTIEEKIKEVRDAYELDDDDEFVGFLQIWNPEILELDDMDEDDWEDFLDYLEENKSEFEEF